MATWFTITFEGDPTEADFARVAEMAGQGFTSGQLINDETTEPEWWSTDERLAHETHMFADGCRLCAAEKRG
jgi:hypothetical protein